MTASSYGTLIEKLNEFIRKYYKNQLLRGGIYSVGLALLFFITFAFAEYYGHFGTSVRTALFYLFIITNGFIFIKYIAVPLSKLYKLGKILSYEEAANIIGKHFSNVQDKLLNVLQLQATANSTSSTYNFNNDLLEASINQKIKELKPVPFTSAIDLNENVKYLKYALIPVFLIAITMFSAPSIIKDGTKRLVKHSERFEKEAPFKFVIENENLTAVAQQDFELKVKLTGDEVPENVYINIAGNEFKLEKENNIKFNYIFKNLQASTNFHLVADGFTSKEYELKALPNPVLLNFDISLVYPNYVNKKNEVVKNTGDLSIPAGTKVTWAFNTQNTQLLNLKFEDTAFAISPSENNAFTYTARFLKDKTYSVSTSNQYFKNKDAVNYIIDVIPDEYPQIEVEEKSDSVSHKQLYFRGDIKDDYGFNKLTFNYRFIVNKDSAVSENFKSITTNTTPIVINKASLNDEFFYFWDMNRINISPGDEVEYYFEIWDNDGVSGSKSTRTQKKIYKAPSLKELEQTTEKHNEEIKDDLEKSITEAKNIQKEISDLQRKMAEKKNLSWEEKRKWKICSTSKNNCRRKLKKQKMPIKPIISSKTNIKIRMKKF